MNMFEPWENAINDSENNIIGKKKYNKKLEKQFGGNIVLFSNDRSQYNKRFFKNDCCGFVAASKEQMLEYSNKIIIIGDITGINTISINNMVEWSHKNNKVYICSECGYIDENNSVITKKIKQEDEKEYNLEHEENELKELPELI